MRCVSYFGSVIAAAVMAVSMLAASSSARADDAADAAGCLAIIGGPAGQTAADLAVGKSPFSDAEKAALTAKRFAENNCSVYAENYVFLAISAAMTALVAANQLPDDYDKLSGALDALIGKIVAGIVSAALSDPNSPLHGLASDLPPGWLDTLNEYIADNLTDKIGGLLKENPVTAQFLGYFNCAAVVATSGVADQVKQSLDNAKSCVAFFETCSKSVSECLGGIGDLGVDIANGVAKLPGETVDALKDGIKDTAKAAAGTPAAVGEAVECDLHPCLTPGVQEEQCAYEVDCKPGQLMDQCTALVASVNCVNVDLECMLDGGGFYQNVAGTWFCKCQDPEGYKIVGGQPTKCAPCAAGEGVDPNSGQCRAGKPNEANRNGEWLACAEWESPYQDATFGYGFCGPKCGEGQKFNGSFGLPKCIPACTSGIFDPVTKQCTSCTDQGKIADFSTGDGTGHTSSIGQCVDCGTGYKFSAGDTNNPHPQCVPACSGGSVLNGQGVCEDCNKENKVAVHVVPHQGSIGSCQACNALLEKREGDSCVPALDCKSWQKLEAKLGGSGTIGPVCVNRCEPGKQYTPFTPGNPGSAPTTKVGPDGKTIAIAGVAPTSGIPESCTACEDKKVLDPASNSCVACDKGQIWHAAARGQPSYCAAPAKAQPVGVPSPTAPIVAPNTLPGATPPHQAPLAECPPGRVRTADGTRCVVELDNDNGFRSGSSGVARPGGATGGGGTLAPAPAPTYRTPSAGGKP